MGTEKRERQKANRQLRLEQLAKDQQRARTKRRALRVGLALAAAVVIALIFFVIGDDGDEAATDTTVAASTSDSATDSTDAVTETTLPAVEEPASTVPGGTLTGETPCPAEGATERVTTFEQPPPTCITPGTTYTATIDTNRGDFTITLDAQRAPVAVNNFVVLARYNYFDGTVCHRIIPGFVVQCGDPTATGTGGPGYEFSDELPASVSDYVRGAVAMANSGPDTNGSQFFVVTATDPTTSFSSPDYSLFGQVTAGLDDVVGTLDSFGSVGGTPTALVQIEDVTITETPAT